MKIKFPVLIKYPKQYMKLMEFLERNTDIKWIEGQKPTHYTPSCLPHTPIYICCCEGWGNEKEIYYKPKREYERCDIEEVEIEIEN